MNYSKEDSIAALATAAGKSAIAVIRLSGKNAFQIINKIFKTNSKSSQQIKYGYIVDGTEKKDEVICSFFKKPHTYTGENLVEISVHGNPIIINEVLNLLYKNGARSAQPGEFTYRAFLNGKKDLAEAEAVCDLITSKTNASIKAALNNIEGLFSSKVKTIKNNLTNLIAFMEANLDHPDIVFLSCEEKLLRLDSYIKDIQNLLKTYKTSKILQNGIKVVIIGKPNVGKSSLLNTIIGKNKAIVTNIAGTTTDVIEETINYKGIPLTIIDTAGIRGHNKNLIELLGQKKTKETIKTADILLWMFDGSINLDQNDLKIATFLKASKLTVRIIAVLNKTDLPLKLSIDSALDINQLTSTIIKISTKNETGIFNLLNEITKVAGFSDFVNDRFMINSRHSILLQNALNSLIKTREILDTKDADEIAHFEIVNAQTALNEILGINTNQDILDTIFSTFCIGK
ncbi:MAG: tRNA uridine-5-carboxymethylaminomethyl(34) synthesis GTPase MnmE [Endomicrobium sp.]|jgi:tRNA modification GTPase|nr:tRNA uridine-5-carboxymethylaminomethyl(34) synthesis GTPase MnmE [Endomicrobium sp.]